MTRVRLYIGQDYTTAGIDQPITLKAGTELAVIDVPEGVSRQGLLEVLRIGPLGTTLLDDTPEFSSPAGKRKRATADIGDAG